MQEFSAQAFENSEDIPLEVLAAEIKNGSSRAEAIFYTRFQPGVLLMLERRLGDRARAEDIAQDTLMIVLTRLRADGIDEPAKLASFVHQTAKYQFIGWLRKKENQNELLPTADDKANEDEPVEEQLHREQVRKQVRTLITEMNIARDREVLHRFYVQDQTKPVICEALDLSATHFDRVINRARGRFKKLFVQQVTS
ncbi:MAG: RNA polymerase sigma factor (sigma-70 family) [Candidatus Azotimanducaceae bacterium]